MLLSAISMFAEQIADGGLSSFDLENKRYSFLEKHDIIFLGCSASSLKEKAAKKELEEIIKLFYRLYSEDIVETWNGSTKTFANFSSEIDKKRK